jgi:hypothetical protein
VGIHAKQALTQIACRDEAPSAQRLGTHFDRRILVLFFNIIRSFALQFVAVQRILSSGECTRFSGKRGAVSQLQL